MRLRLADVKKSILRRDGDVYVAPQLLGPRAPLRQIAALVALYESRIGTARATFPQDAPGELIGDYRLARCLEICLQEWYVWESPRWPGSASEVEARALAEREIASPADLRIALYDAVNRDHGGFLAATDRNTALDASASACGIGRGTLDALLYLDGDEHAVLRRMTEEPPNESDLVARYNQQVVEALLANAARVEWTLPPAVTDPAGGGLGAVVKRVCFLARSMGVQYEVEFAPDADDERDAPGAWRQARVAEERHRYGVNRAREAGSDTLAVSLDACLRPLHVTLYGPQEVTGAPNQYGQRLARLCRALLGYRRHIGGAALAADGIRGLARVYLHGRAVTFVLDDRLLKLLRGAGPHEASDDQDFSARLFDSSLEQGLYDELMALERAGEAHGWHIEREPEPVLAAGTILVADFALTRGARRVYLEIAGYWRPEYRERKLRKLQAVRDVVALLVAIPESARQAFAPLSGTMPLLWYRTRVGARSLLDALDTAYADADARLAAIDFGRVQAEVQRRGCIPPAESMRLLSCYTRTELAEAVARLQAAAAGDAGAPQWMDGIGLCSAAWQAHLFAQVRDVVANSPEGRIPLSALREHLVAQEPALRDGSESQVETLVSLAGLHVARASIFEADVRLDALSCASDAPAVPSARPRKAQPRSAPRRKHRDASYTTPSVFPAEPTSDGGTGPTTTLSPTTS
jgi:predicted nuclease of restriction endonuclease-like RecB superfamily